MNIVWAVIRSCQFWHTKTWHRLLGHTVTIKEMPLPEFDSECSCGTWWFTKGFNWEELS